MKTNHLQKTVAVIALATLAWSASTVSAQDSSPAQPAAVTAPAPQLAYGVPQILQLAQAKVGDATIIAYIKNSGTTYGLTADQIIYLRQKGISDAVITTMLNQPKPAFVASAPPAPAPQPAAAPASPQPVSTATVAPTVTYIQTAPAPVYYYSQPYYYPVYGGIYPAVSFSFGWGGGFGRGWHGGWHR